MKSKLRNAIIVSILCLMALCSVIALVAVFAANNQIINSAISVSFKAPGILGKVSANYYIGSQDTSGTPMTTDGTSSGTKELVFNGAEGFGSLNPQGDIELTLKNNFVVFEYIFQNGLGNPVTNDYMAELSLNTNTTNNIKMTTKQSKEKLTDFNMIVNEVESTTGNDKGWMVVEHNEEGNLISTKYFYVKAEIDNPSIDASFSGNFNWELDIAKPTLDALTFTLVKNDHYSVAHNTSASASTDIIIPKTYTGDDGIERPVTEIASSGFYNYKSDGHIYIPDSITSIKASAFNGCSAIKGELIIPDNVESVGKYAFMDCNIQSLVLEIDDTKFETVTFNDVQSLTIDSPNFMICSYIIESYPFQSLIIGAKPINVSNVSFECDMSKLKNIYVNTANENYTSRDKLGNECNVLIHQSTKTIIFGCNNSIIPADDSVTTIGNSSFCMLEFQSVELPDNITIIEDYAFAQCSSLKSIKLGVNLTSIGICAFWNCNNLTTIKIGENVTSIGGDAFAGCVNLAEVIIDSPIVCAEIEAIFISSYLLDYATTIKAKYEISYIEYFEYTKSENRDIDGYWVYSFHPVKIIE